MPSNDTTTNPQQHAGSNAELGLLTCDNCGRKFDPGFEGVTSSTGRELCIHCQAPEDMAPGEFIPD